MYQIKTGHQKQELIRLTNNNMDFQKENSFNKENSGMMTPMDIILLRTARVRDEELIEFDY